MIEDDKRRLAFLKRRHTQDDPDREDSGDIRFLFRLLDEATAEADHYADMFHKAEETIAFITAERDTAMAELDQMVIAYKNSMLLSLTYHGELERAMARLTVSGHNQPCYYCGKLCNNLAGDPGEWSVSLCHPEDPGVAKWHHANCVYKRSMPYRAGIEAAAQWTRENWQRYCNDYKGQAMAHDLKRALAYKE